MTRLTDRLLARPADLAVGAWWRILATRETAATRLLGPRCDRCWQRVYPRDEANHALDCDDL